MPDDSRQHDLKVEQFTVDAALLRELGQRLIGRAHIALAELVKNSYDADAHTCRIDIEENQVVITDDGHGISEEEFFKYWLRIGTTHKVQSRRSRDLKRPMTGSKGLGRLSVQFLADEMEMESNCENDPSVMLYTYVDWRNIQSGKDLHTVNVGWETRPESTTYADDSKFGTRITLKGLRTKWDSGAVENLGNNVWRLRSPFRSTGGHDRGKTALDFYVDLDAPHIESAKAHFDKLQMALFENWKARITGQLEEGRREGDSIHASVTVEFAKNYPEDIEDGSMFRETVTFPVVRQKEREEDDESPTGRTEEEVSRSSKSAVKEESLKASALDKARFVILVFKTEGRQHGGLSVQEMRDYLRAFGGVSVFDAGFRLPYYGSQDLSGHDWLEVGVDQGRRLIVSELLPEKLRTGARYLLDLPNPGRIFGAVDVDTNHEHNVAVNHVNSGEWLQIQPGRDRLAPNRSFEQLRDLVRFGLDFYANRYRALADDVAQRQHANAPPSRILDSALTTLERHRPVIPSAPYQELRRELTAVRTATRAESKAIDSRAALLGTLATAGMAALAMNHELSNDAVLLEKLSKLLHQLPEAESSPKVKNAVKALEEYRSRLNAYRFLFSPLADPEERQATERLPVYSVVTQAARSLRSRLSGVAFGPYAISRDLYFPLGAFAEWSAILQNVLFNAWNAMLEAEQRIIRFDGSSPSLRGQHLRVSDTGTGLAMPLDESQILFEPFERRTSIMPANRSIAIGGQGLGLAIVRMIAGSRGVNVGFVEPHPGFSTTIELSWRS